MKIILNELPDMFFEKNVFFRREYFIVSEYRPAQSGRVVMAKMAVVMISYSALFQILFDDKVLLF